MAARQSPAMMWGRCDVWRGKAATMTGDDLWLEFDGIAADVLTGIYSEETHLPQPLRLTVRVRLDVADHYAPETPLSASKNYMDLKAAALDAVSAAVHFTLIESVADHIVDRLMADDPRVAAVVVKIVKLAIAEGDEAIGITLTRQRRPAPAGDAPGDHPARAGA